MTDAFNLEVFIDPSLSASPETGDGSIGSPYASLENAFASATPTGTARFNIKAGTPAVISQNIATMYSDNGWSGSFYLQGYNSAAGDGGIGEIDGDAGGFPIWSSSSLDNITFQHLKMGNVAGASHIVLGDDGLSILFCELYGQTSGTYFASGDQNGNFIGNYVHDVAGGLQIEEGNCLYNRIETSVASEAIESSAGAHMHIRHNLIVLSNALCRGMEIREGRGVIIDSNAIYNSAGGTRAGIKGSSSSNLRMLRVTNNVIQGFSGSGGHGIDLGDGDGPIGFLGGNSVYDCETAFDYNDGNRTILRRVGVDEILTESPFVDAANGDFTPKNVGALYEGHLPAKIAGDFF